jgi:hypothetical protein
MTPKTKKVLVITISLLSLAGLSYFAYTYLKKKKDDVSSGDKDNTTSSDTPPVVTTNTGVRTVPTPTPNDIPSFDPNMADKTSGGRIKTLDDPLSKDEAKYYTQLFQGWHNQQEYPKAPILKVDGVLGAKTKDEYTKYGVPFLTYLFSNLRYNNMRISRIDKYFKSFKKK